MAKRDSERLKFPLANQSFSALHKQRNDLFHYYINFQLEEPMLCDTYYVVAESSRRLAEAGRGLAITWSRSQRDGHLGVTGNQQYVRKATAS